MNTKVMTLAALVSSVLLANIQEAAAQANPLPSATAHDRRRHRRRKLPRQTPARRPQQLRQPARPTRIRLSKK